MEENNTKTEHIPTLWDALSADDSLSALYPALPEDYFDDKSDAFAKETTNPLEKLYDQYNSASIKPYAKIRNLNATKDGETECASKPAVEIGIQFSF